MKLEELKLPVQSAIMQAYLDDASFLHTYFDYPNEEQSYEERVMELQSRTFQHVEVANVIESFMGPFGIGEQGAKHIDELRQGAVAVVGGQQAGVLTGPLYSVHKAITAILLAEKQRKLLKMPVVPIFWIAGEDHDLNEINHVYSKVGERIVKEQMSDSFALKLMASDAVYNQKEMEEFIRNTFSKFGETLYTKDLLEEAIAAVYSESTFTQFFVRLMNGLFKEQGLLFIDAAYPPLRQLEKEYFKQFIEHSKTIANDVYQTEQALEKRGFSKPIVAAKDAANLFLQTMKGRMLLTRRDHFFVNDSAGIKLSKAELLEIAEKTPERLSNNVVTRPIMQDFVLPVLAFVGGPGEIAYWALLKEAFHTVAIKMPIIVPRMSMTLLTKRSQKLLVEKNFTLPAIFEGNIEREKSTFIQTLHNPEFETEIKSLEETLTKHYEKFKTLFSSEDTMIQDLMDKNLQYHERQLLFLKNKAEDALLVKNNVELDKFIYLETEIYPNGQLQERIYTPYSYLNEYGPTLIDDLIQLPFEMNSKHKVIYL